MRSEEPYNMEIKEMILEIDELTINYHITESCNFNCKFCYSKWEYDEPCQKFDVDLTKQFMLIKELYDFFSEKSTCNPLRKFVRWNNLRLNITGGEPLLIPNLDKIVAYANKLGFRVSIITNGYYVTNDFLEKTANNLYALGFSIDSSDDETQRELGRVTRGGKSCSLNDMKEMVKSARRINSKILIKVNTVINRRNLLENFSKIVDSIQPDKWTLVQMLPFFNKLLSVSREDFYKIVNKYSAIKQYRRILHVEENRDCFESFILVTPDGKFYCNSDIYKTGSYIYSDGIIEIGAEKAFDQVNFSINRFISRNQKELNINNVLKTA